MNWLKQPSTWRGVFILAGLLGFKLQPELQDAITTAVIAALALVEVIRNEHAPALVNIQLPPIDLVSRPAAGPEPVELRRAVPAKSNTIEAADSGHDDFPGWGS